MGFSSPEFASGWEHVDGSGTCEVTVVCVVETEIDVTVEGGGQGVVGAVSVIVVVEIETDTAVVGNGHDVVSGGAVTVIVEGKAGGQRGVEGDGVETELVVLLIMLLLLVLLLVVVVPLLPLPVLVAETLGTEVELSVPAGGRYVAVAKKQGHAALSLGT